MIYNIFSANFGTFGLDGLIIVMGQMNRALERK